MANIKPGVYYGPSEKTPAMRKLEAKMMQKVGKMIEESDKKQEQARRDIMWLRMTRRIV